MPPKKNKKAAAEAHVDFVTEADNEVSQKAVKVKNSEEIEMMAVKFIVLDPLHPFHRLNGVSGTIDISKILDDIPREKVDFIF